MDVGEADHRADQSRVMPFGLCNALSTLKQLMDTMLEGILGDGCWVYLGNIVVHGRTWKECLDWLLQVLAVRSGP